MKKGTTKNGFEYEIKDEALNDMRVMDALMELDEVEDEEDSAKALFAMSKVASLLLGKKQKERLYAHIQTKDKTVPMDVFMETMGEILTEDVKN